MGVDLPAPWRLCTHSPTDRSPGPRLLPAGGWVGLARSAYSCSSSHPSRDVEVSTDISVPQSPLSVPNSPAALSLELGWPR